MELVRTIDRMRQKHVREAVKRATEDRKRFDAILQTKGIKGLVRVAGEDEALLTLPCVSTGSQDFDDFLTGRGKNYSTIPGSGRGLPRGRIVEMFGGESSGKTTTALAWLAGWQRAGMVCAFVDAEHAYDASWAEVQGVDNDKLLFSQPEYGEQASETILNLAKTGNVDLIVVDSVDALVPKKMLEGAMDKKDAPGEHARLMSRLLRRLVALCSHTGTTVVFINQIRMKIGVLWGNPEDTPGGKALKFYASIRIDLRRVATLKKSVKVTRIVGKRKNGKDKIKTERKDRAYANVVRAKLVKSKVSPPNREVTFHIEYARGITDFE